MFTFTSGVAAVVFPAACGCFFSCFVAVDVVAAAVVVATVVAAVTAFAVAVVAAFFPHSYLQRLLIYCRS